MMRVSASVLVAALAPFVLAACGDDASPPPGQGSGGRASDAGTGGRAPGSGGADAAETDATVEPPEDGGGEPSLPRRLVLLHGLTDSPWIGFCFAKVADGVEGELAPDLFPRDGLEYGHSLATDELPGVRIGEDAVRPYVVAARSADVVRGLDCTAIARRARETANPDVPDASTDGGAGGAVSRDADVARDAGNDAASDAGADADAAPPPPAPIAEVRMTGLPVLTGAVLARDSSYLLGVFGCLGGVGVTHPSQLSICGVEYAPDRPTITETLVRLSRRTDVSAVGLQFIVGTPTFGRSDLRLVPGAPGDPIPVASDVGVGALRPQLPYFGATAFEIGTAAPAARVQVYASGGSLAAYDATWRDTLRAGDLDTLQNGSTYTLALMGPTPGFGAALWWNAALVSLIRNAE